MMTYLDDLNVKRYLPTYRFPRILSCFFVCLALLFLVALLTVFVTGPFLIQYIGERDPVPALDITLGETVSLRDFEIRFASIEADCFVIDIQLADLVERLCLPTDTETASTFLGANFVRAEQLSEREIRLFFILFEEATS